MEVAETVACQEGLSLKSRYGFLAFALLVANSVFRINIIDYQRETIQLTVVHLNLHKHIDALRNGIPVTDWKYGEMILNLELHIIAVVFATRPDSSDWDSSI